MDSLAGGAFGVMMVKGSIKGQGWMRPAVLGCAYSGPG